MSTVAIPLSVKALKKGDRFESVVRNNIAATSGTIASVGRVNLKFDAMYMGRHPLTNIKLPVANLIGGYVIRDGQLHAVVA